MAPKEKRGVLAVNLKNTRISGQFGYGGNFNYPHFLSTIDW